METLAERIRAALNQLIVLNDFEARGLLLRNMPFANTVNRNSAKLTDIAQIVDRTIEAGKLPNTGTYALESVLKQAIQLMNGTEPATQLALLLNEFLANPESVTLCFGEVSVKNSNQQNQFRPHAESNADPYISIVQTDKGLIRWTGMPIEQLVSHCWGSTNGGSGTRVYVRFDAQYETAESLAHCLFRLAIHGGIRVLEVPDAVRWGNLCRNAAENCIGTKDKNWSPSTSWQFADLKPEKNSQSSSCTDGALGLIDNVAIAKILEEAMNQWLLKRLNGLLNRVAMGDSLELMNITIHSDYYDSFRRIWAQWYLICKDEPQILKHFLSCMMTTSENMPKQLSVGLLRGGPRTLETCLLPAIVFALVIESAIETNLMPVLESAPANFEIKDESAQLVGLELIRGKAFTQAILQLQWRTGYVFLTHERTPIAELRQLRSMGACHDHVRRFTQPSLNTSTIITQDPTISRLIQDQPPYKLREYLQAKILEFNQQMRTKVREALMERSTASVA